MGAGSSQPAPPPRVSRKLEGTTIQLQHLPPLITTNARAVIRLTAEAKAFFLSTQTASTSECMTDAHARLSSSIISAHKAGSFRDYLVLLIEKAILGLSTGTGGPGSPLRELACLINPFLSKDRDEGFAAAGTQVDESGSTLESLRFGSSFRPADLEQVADEEKDLLVLLFYSSDIGQHADETIEFVSRISEKSGTSEYLGRRRESFSEMEVYVQWTVHYLSSYLAHKPAGIRLSALSDSKLQAETSANLTRLLAVCDMLVKEHRLDQACFLMQLLDISAHPETSGHTRRRVEALASAIKKKRGEERALQEWHGLFAEAVIQDLRRAKDTGKDRWGFKGGAKVEVGPGRFDLFKTKKD